MMSFKDKVVVITGASSGIGAATAVSFAKEGAHVVMIGRNETKLKSVAKDCVKNGVTPLVIKADVANDDDAKRVIKETIDKHKKLDILINNAGITVNASILDGNILEAYDEVLSVNLRAAIHLTSLAIPHLIESQGSIVNISSILGKIVKTPNYCAYSISKAGLDMFTRCAALELASSGVRVVSISPGPVRTDMIDNNDLQMTWEDIAGSLLLKRVSDPEEVADLILYLASDKAKGITGSDFVCDNGAILKWDISNYDN